MTDQITLTPFAANVLRQFEQQVDYHTKRIEKHVAELLDDPFSAMCADWPILSAARIEVYTDAKRRFERFLACNMTDVAAATKLRDVYAEYVIDDAAAPSRTTSEHYNVAARARTGAYADVSRMLKNSL